MFTLQNETNEQFRRYYTEHDGQCRFKHLRKGSLVYFLVALLERPLINNPDFIEGTIGIIGPVPERIGYINFNCKSGVCKIESIDVLPLERDKGFGSSLLQYLEDNIKAEGVRWIIGGLPPMDYRNREKLYHFFQRTVLKSIVRLKKPNRAVFQRSYRVIKPDKRINPALCLGNLHPGLFGPRLSATLHGRHYSLKNN